MRVSILDDYFDTLRGLPSYRLLDGHDVSIHHDHVQEVDALAERLAEAEALVLIRERTTITADLLARVPSLRLISQRGGYPHVDVEACTRHGVMLCSNTSADAPSYATAELTWALILASLRQLPQQAASLRAGTWQMGVGRTLRGRTLGLYGYGRIARAVATYAEAFGVRTWWWGSERARTELVADGRDMAPSRSAFFADSDIVSVHIRLAPATRHVITAADLGAMRPTALFVNTSRAGVVEPGALEAALLAGRPGNAAVDVYDIEPLPATDDPFIHHPNLLATPHIGYVTEEEWDMQFTDMYDQINAFAAGRPINVVNPAVLG